MVNFPMKDKQQLMKLLEDLDNRVEVAHDILNSELGQGRIHNEDPLGIRNI